MDNLIIIDSVDIDTIQDKLNKTGVDRAHFTNGTYSYDAEMIVPTTLAGFSYIDSEISRPEDSFIIAVNSDLSMNGIMNEKGASFKERANLESQITRAEKVAKPLAEKFPDRKVIVLFYDEPTPTSLYDALALGYPEGMVSLHKWGYGTDSEAPKIEGAHNFSKVLAFPLPNDEKPVCYDITVAEDQSDVVQVVKLTEATNAAGQPYFPAPRNVI